MKFVISPALPRTQKTSQRLLISRKIWSPTTTTVTCLLPSMWWVPTRSGYMFHRCMYRFARAVMTQHYRLHSLTNRNLLPVFLEAVSPGPRLHTVSVVSSEFSLPLVCEQSVFLWGPLCVLPSTERPAFKFSPFLRAPVRLDESPYYWPILTQPSPKKLRLPIPSHPGALEIRSPNGIFRGDHLESQIRSILTGLAFLSFLYFQCLVQVRTLYFYYTSTVDTQLSTSVFRLEKSLPSSGPKNTARSPPPPVPSLALQVALGTISKY